MNPNENVLSNRTLQHICPVQPHIGATPMRYDEAAKEVSQINAGFAERLFQLRSAKGVSAREMSLDLGQGAGYISNLENGHNLPSMSQFFAICTYLQIAPSQFFAYGTGGAKRLAELNVLATTLSDEDLELLTAIARKLTK